MTLVFVPPCATVGANVVWVQACTSRDMPSGQLGEHVGQLDGVEQRVGAAPAGSCIPSTKRRHTSCMCASGW